MHRYGWAWFGLASILFLPVFVDLINGILIYKTNSSLSFGVLYRGGLFAFLLAFLFLIKEKWLTLYGVILVGLFLVGLIVWTATGLVKPSYDFSVIIKVLFPTVILAFLFFINERIHVTADQLINMFLGFCFVASVAVVFSLITGIGINTYGNDEVSYSYGTKSLFKAQNDLGITLLVGYTFAFYKLFKSFRLRNLILATLIIVALVALSTRAGIIGAFAVTVGFSIAFFFSPTTDLRLTIPLRLILMGVGLLLMVILLYQFIQLISEYNYLIKKFEALAKEHPREKLQSAGMVVLEKRPWINQLFGEGAYGFGKGVAKMPAGLRKINLNGKMIEIDYIDLFGNYGLLFTLVFYTVPLVAFGKSVLNFFQSRTLQQLAIVLAFTVLLGHSFLAGHVFMTPMVAGPLALILFLSFANPEREAR
ncbi:MAG: hypothetical protein ACI9FU_000734 [Granulosicoccus sp.]|jgi:hypothetical protein